MQRNVVEGVRLPKNQRQEMRVLDREEQERLIMAARLAPEPAAFGIIFDLFTGLRLGELCGLRWENVSMEHQVFQVCETRNRLPNYDSSIEAATSVRTVATTKTENSRRTVYLLDDLFHDLESYKAMGDSPLLEVSASLMKTRESAARACLECFCRQFGKKYHREDIVEALATAVR